MHFPAFNQTLRQADKRLIFGPPTQALRPLRYPSIYDAFKHAIRNNWTPEEIGLGEDRTQYRDLAPAVRNQYDINLSMLTTMDMVVTDSIAEHVTPCASAPEFRSWIARQTFDEANHSDSYAFIIDGIGLDEQQVFDRYLTDETLYAKMEMADQATKQLKGAADWFNQPDLNTPHERNMQVASFIKGYAFFPLILEGTWFTMGLKAGLYAAQFHGKMRGTADQFIYILRDEMVHADTGLKAINIIKQEYPEAWTAEVISHITELAQQGIALERKFASHAYAELPGLSTNDYIEHCQHTLSHWLRRIGISLWPEAKPRLSWFNEAIESRKETNFFERRVTEYQQGTGLNWED